MNNNDTIIVASFAEESSAGAAIENLREWDKRVREVKLGVIGLVHQVDGVVKAEVVYGGFFNRSLPISDDAIRVLAQELGSRVAVVVACDDFEAAMVSDGLVRDGGRILVNSYERTAEEESQEQKDITEALKEQVLREASDTVKLTPGRNINRPL